MKLKIMVLGLFASIVTLHAVNVGEVLPEVRLEKDSGGDANGKPWDAKSLKGKVHVILYMDPDERKVVMPFLDVLNNKSYDKTKYSTVAIVNLAATWMPDVVLETMLGKKQKELHNTEFIFDKTKHLVKAWNLEDDASNVLVVDKEMKILYQHRGEVSSSEIDKILDIIAKNIN